MMKRKNLLELKLTIPCINLLDSRTLLGGTQYTLDLGDISGVEIITERVNPDEGKEPHEDPWEDEEGYNDGEDDRETDTEENNIMDEKIVENFNPTSGQQITGGCAYSALLEIYNHNRSSNLTLSNVYSKWLAYCQENDMPFSPNGMTLEHVVGFYEFLFEAEICTDVIGSLDCNEVLFGWMELDDGTGHAVVVIGYRCDDEGDYDYYYWDPATDEKQWDENDQIKFL